MTGQEIESPTAGSNRTFAPIELALNDILASAPFRNSQQAQRLVRYVVERSFAHEEHLLRERVIGSVVFGRPPDYDTGSDPVVRIRASEVRKRLAQYYQSAPHPPAVFIDIPAGSYRAQFRWRDEAAGSKQDLVELEPEEEHRLPGPRQQPELHEQVQGIHGTHWLADPEIVGERSRFERRYFVLACVLLACVISGAAVWEHMTASAVPFTAFWQPWVKSPKPVLIAVGSNAVYRLSDDLTAPYEQAHHLETHGADFFIPLPPDAELKGRQILPAPDSFVALGDVAAVSALVATLTAKQQSYQERFPNDISFVELRNSPSILVGGFNNPMTIELTKKLPFVLASRTELDDTVHGRHWMLHASDDSHDTEDYAIITRLVQAGGDGPVLSVAGMGQYGTLAAANFVANPQAIGGLARKLPSGWPKRNLQLVLHLHVVDFKPTAVEVVGFQVW